MINMSLSNPPASPAVIRREDYQPPAWLVPEVRLDFQLGLDATMVRSRIFVRRNGTASTLHLNGDGIAARSVKVDGQPSNGWRMEGSDLLIDLSNAGFMDYENIEMINEFIQKSERRKIKVFIKSDLAGTILERIRVPNYEIV